PFCAASMYSSNCRVVKSPRFPFAPSTVNVTSPTVPYGLRSRAGGTRTRCVGGPCDEQPITASTRMMGHVNLTAAPGVSLENNLHHRARLLPWLKHGGRLRVRSGTSFSPHRRPD